MDTIICHDMHTSDAKGALTIDNCKSITVIYYVFRLKCENACIVSSYLSITIDNNISITIDNNISIYY